MSSASLKDTNPTLSAESLERRDEVDKRSPPAVEAPDDDHIELPPTRGGEQGFTLLAQTRT
jgi:hypothetical protein